jgi:hypothetical protein
MSKLFLPVALDFAAKAAAKPELLFAFFFVSPPSCSPMYS